VPSVRPTSLSVPLDTDHALHLALWLSLYASVISVSIELNWMLLQCDKLHMIRGPNRLQRHAWPAVWQGGDVVGVAEQGKTLSYALPLLNMLHARSNYSSLPKYGMGVRFIVSM